MALAGDCHVVVTIINHLGCLTGFAGDQGCRRGKKITLAFLTAECPAHTANLYRNGVLGNAKNMGDFVLDFAWVL